MIQNRKNDMTALRTETQKTSERLDMTSKQHASMAEGKDVIRFSFSVGKDEKIAIKRVHSLLLDHMIHNFDTTFFDINGKKFNIKDYPTGEIRMREYFAINGSYSKTRKLLTIGHYFKSRFSLTEMKQDSNFFHLIKKHKVQVHYHKWDLDTLELRSIGFVLNINPGHKNEIIAISEIENYMNQNRNSVKFDLHFSVTYSTNGQNSTLAYSIQVAKNDVSKAFEIMNGVNADKKAPFKFIAYKSKYDNPTGFDNAINIQNKFLNSQKVIPIIGINEKTMNKFGDQHKSLNMILKNKKEEKIIKFSEIVKTDKTKKQGRWNVIVDSEDFENTSNFLRNNILSLCNQHPEYKHKEFEIDDATVSYQSIETKTIIEYDNTFLNSLKKEEIIARSSNKFRGNIDWGSETSSISDEKPKVTYKDKLMNKNPTQSATTARNTIEIESQYANISALSSELEETKTIVSNLEKKIKSMEENQQKEINIIKTNQVNNIEEQRKFHKEFADHMTQLFNKMYQQFMKKNNDPEMQDISVNINTSKMTAIGNTNTRKRDTMGEDMDTEFTKKQNNNSTPKKNNRRKGRNDLSNGDVTMQIFKDND